VSVEMLALTPWLFVLALVAFQVGVIGWGVTSAGEAVRQGVRAQSLGQDGCAAARATLTSTLAMSGCTATGGALGEGNAVSIVVEVPVLRPAADWTPRVQVTREAFLP
jgi:hypothetical protein